MENFDNLDILVKLASFGAAGISILAVFIIGMKIFNLPNDTSSIKASVLKFYMSTCIFMTVISGVSGVANAYFNQEKIIQANNNFDQLSTTYKDELQKVENEKKEIDATLVSLRRQLRSVNNLPASVSTTLNKTETQVNQIKMLPYDQAVNSIRDTEKIRRINR